MSTEERSAPGLEADFVKRVPGFTLEARFSLRGAAVLFGPSGAGKTLAIRAIAGLERPDLGYVALEHAGQKRALFDAAAGIDLPVERRRLGVVFQEPRLFPHLNVTANLLYGRPKGAPKAKLDEVADLLEIGALLDRRPRRLSGGEKQRVAIGRALLSDPQALLMDEPLANLDSRLKAEILPYLARIRRETRIPILYVTHDMAEARAVGGRLIRLDRGRVVEEAPL